MPPSIDSSAGARAALVDANLLVNATFTGARRIAAELAETPGLRGDDVADVESAAVAIEHGLVLASHDHGFRRFARLRVVDPLAGDGT